MAVRKVIKIYFIEHVAKKEFAPNCRNMIHCCEGDELSSVAIGILSFNKDGTALPRSHDMMLYFYESQFDSIVNTLRLESPVIYYFESDNDYGVTTRYEPVGEEEGGSD